MPIQSPLTLSNNVSLVKNIRVNKIIHAYNRSHGIDVSSYFLGLKKISIYRCNDTGYLFYYPFNITGDSLFYEFFQKFDWYYMPWKWEHEMAMQYIKPDFRILEVGCGQGAFLKKINDLFKLSFSVGLELNESAKVFNDKFEIINSTIQTYSNSNKESFDLVCSFQVLEHIPSAHDFLTSSISSLKRGGVLLISVPNNKSYLKNSDGCLNMPPHHVGLWDEMSLKSLENIFPLKVLSIQFEELQQYHVAGELDSKFYSQYHPILNKIIIKLHKLLGVYQKRFKSIDESRHNIIGHTVLVAYEKL